MPFLESLLYARKYSILNALLVASMGVLASTKIHFHFLHAAPAPTSQAVTGLLVFMAYGLRNVHLQYLYWLLPFGFLLAGYHDFLYVGLLLMAAVSFLLYHGVQTPFCQIPSLRANRWTKPILISVCWFMILYGPLLAKEGLSIVMNLQVTSQMLLVLTLCLLSDFQDRSIDQQAGTETLMNSISINGSRLMILLLLTSRIFLTANYFQLILTVSLIGMVLLFFLNEDSERKRYIFLDALLFVDCLDWIFNFSGLSIPSLPGT